MTTTLLSASQRAGTTALQAADRAARADAAAWGRTLETAARTIAVAAVACYAAGEALGRWVHQLNDQLAALHRCLLAGRHQATAAAEVALAPVAEAATELVDLIEEATGLPLACLTVLELRTLARQRLGSSARLEGRRISAATKRQLLSALA